MLFSGNLLALIVIGIVVCEIFFVGLWLGRRKSAREKLTDRRPPARIAPSVRLSSFFTRLSMQSPPQLYTQVPNEVTVIASDRDVNLPPPPLYAIDPAIDTAIEDAQFVKPRQDKSQYIEELTMPVKIPSFNHQATANLVHMSGGGNLPKKLSLKPNESARFGRNAHFCQYVLDDICISRLHATILQQADLFAIQDEDSTGGTFVNGRKLALTERQLLKDGDLIGFNDVLYRFEIVG